MGKTFSSLQPHHQEFIKDQKMFFVATAMDQGFINISPKGMDSFRILDPQQVLWLNVTGSGNETATHVKYHPRMTIMFCAFEGKPNILRLYGQANVYHPRHHQWEQYVNMFPKAEGARQIFEVRLELIQTSCGFGIPLMDYQGERTLLQEWTRKKGPEGVQEYWQKKNTISLDGHETGINQ